MTTVGQDKFWRSMDGRVTTQYFYDKCTPDFPQDSPSQIAAVVAPAGDAPAAEEAASA